VTQKIDNSINTINTPIDKNYNRSEKDRTILISKSGIKDNATATNSLSNSYNFQPVKEKDLKQSKKDSNAFNDTNMIQIQQQFNKNNFGNNSPVHQKENP